MPATRDSRWGLAVRRWVTALAVFATGLAHAAPPSDCAALVALVRGCADGASCSELHEVFAGGRAARPIAACFEPGAAAQAGELGALVQQALATPALEDDPALLQLAAHFGLEPVRLIAGLGTDRGDVETACLLALTRLATPEALQAVSSHTARHVTRGSIQQFEAAHSSFSPGGWTARGLLGGLRRVAESPAGRAQAWVGEVYLALCRPTATDGVVERASGACDRLSHVAPFATAEAAHLAAAQAVRPPLQRLGLRLGITGAILATSAGLFCASWFSRDLDVGSVLTTGIMALAGGALANALGLGFTERFVAIRWVLTAVGALAGLGIGALASRDRGVGRPLAAGLMLAGAATAWTVVVFGPTL